MESSRRLGRLSSHFALLNHLDDFILNTTNETMTPTATIRRKKKPTASIVRKRNSKSEPSFSKMYLRIHKVKCLKTTKEILKKDEIVIGAVKVVGQISEKRGKKIVTPKGKSGKSIRAGKFRKGTVQAFSPPRVIASFSYGGKTGGWPRKYPATLVLVEMDKGKLGSVINSAVKAIEKNAVKLATTLAAGAVAGAAGGPIGAAAGAAAAMGLSAIKKAKGHDVIGSKKSSVNLGKAPRKVGMIPNSKKELLFQGQGAKYKVTYSWAVK